MSADIKNNLALVGAGGSGISFACAMSLAKNGFDVIITGRRQEVLTKAALEIKNETKVILTYFILC